MLIWQGISSGMLFPSSIPLQMSGLVYTLAQIKGTNETLCH